MIYSAIVFLPLLGALIAGLFGRVIGDRPSEVITTGLMMTAAALSWFVFIETGFAHDAAKAAIKVPVMRWITSGDLEAAWVLRIDTLTAVMLIVVTTVSSLVHLYSIGYMHEDDSRPRFFSYLSLFTFAMLALVTSDNLLQMFFGWEGVGLASYLLIGFWYHKPEANAAAIKAFVVNRVGDFGFALGIFGVFFIFKTISLDEVFRQAPDMAGKTMNFLGYDVDILTTLALLLFMGAMGKSAQFLLHTWLPDAMEGPTPVSALIHAATMVTAGVFMVARLSPLFEQAPAALEFVVLIGAITAFFAATVGLVQNDIKRVIAYSTCSQLGYMFVACGVGAYTVGIFHLFTHAFFKALLFLGAGSVIHAMHHEQDMRNMGGLKSKIPITWAMMLIGTLALTGVGIPHVGRLRGLPFQGRHRGSGLCGAYAGQLRVLAAGRRGAYDVVLFVAADVHDVLRQDARGTGHLQARAREPLCNVDPALCAGHRRGARGHCIRAILHRAPSVGVLGDIRHSRQGHHAPYARGAGVGDVGAVRSDGFGLRYCLPLLHCSAGPAGEDGQRFPPAVSLPAQQMVLRRVVRFHFRTAGEGARTALLEGR